MAHVTLKELAVELGLDRSSMRKYVLKHGFTPFTVRSPDSHSQQTLALTNDDAEQVRVLRESEGYGGTGTGIGKPNGWGYFYVIQVVPEFAPQRLKLGFTTEVAGRLAAHRTAAPTAHLVKAWPCRKAWESAAIDSVTRIDCTPLSNEVFDVDSVDALIARADQFFDMMPRTR